METATRLTKKINPKEIEKIVKLLTQIPSFEVIIVNHIEIPLDAPWDEIQAYLRSAFEE